MQERTQERVEETGFMKFLGLQEFDTEMAEGGVATGAAQRRRAVNSTPTMSDELVAVKRQQLVNALATHRAMKETRKLLGMAVHSGRLAKGDKVGKVVLTAVDGYQSATRDSRQNHGLESMHTQCVRPFVIIQHASANIQIYKEGPMTLQL